MGRHIARALSLVSVFSCSAVLAQQVSRTQVVPLKLYGQHLIVVQGSIGSLGKRNLVIDTGAYPSIIDRSVAQKMRLSGHAEEVDAVNQTVRRTAVIVPSVDLGPIHATAVRALVDDLSPLSQQVGVRIDALIGLDVLGYGSFRIDYAAKHIFFGPVAPLPSSAPFERVDSMICLRLRVGHQSLRLLVDTGAEKILLLARHVSELTTRSKQSQEFRNLAGPFTLRQISLQNLQLGDTDLATQPIFVSDAANLPPYQFDGFLSTVQFRQIAFDFERQEFSWMTNDQRRDLVRVASTSAEAPPYVALSMEPASKPEAWSVWSSEETGDARRWLRIPFRSRADGR
jgi:predicted aspartyl protease